MKEEKNNKNKDRWIKRERMKRVCKGREWKKAKIITVSMNKRRNTVILERKGRRKGERRNIITALELRYKEVDRDKTLL